jgi:hypothetical protein
MQPGNPYHLIEAVGSCQVGSVWSAIDPQGRSLMVALLDPNVATDLRWREAFQEAANALVQAGEPGYLYADFASSSPWVAYSAENGIGAERVFLALGMDFQPVPPDGVGSLDYTPFEPTTQVMPGTPAAQAPPAAEVPGAPEPPAAPVTPGPLPPDMIGATSTDEAPPTTVFPPVQPGPPATESAQPVAAQQSPAAPAHPAPAAQSAPDHDDVETTQPTQRMQLPPTAPPAPVNPWADTSPQQADPPPVPLQAQSAPVSPPPVSSTPPHPISGAPHPTSGAPTSVPPHPTYVSPHPTSVPPHPTSVPPHPTSVPPHPTSGAPRPVSGTPMSPAYGQPLSPAYGQPAPAYGPRPPQGPAPYDPYAPVSPPPRRSRTSLWIGIAVAVLVLIAGGGGVYAWTASGGEPKPPVASASASTLPPAPMPTASPLFPGLEPPRKGTWPAQWPKFAATDALRTLSDLDGLDFTLKVPRTWDCSAAGRAEGFAKYNCGISPGTNPELGGELIVRTCPDGCSEERRTTMRQAEEAWGLQWIQSGEFSAYAESSSLQIEGEKRYGLVVVAYWRSGAEGSIDRQIVFRMTAPVDGAGQLRRVANYIRDTVIF